MGRKTKKVSAPAVNAVPEEDNQISSHLDLIEKANRSIQKSISSFGARLNLIRHLIGKI